jgi:hypothetical protein
VRLKATRNIRTLPRPQRRSQTRLRCSRRTLRTRAPPQRIKLPRYQRVGEFRVFLLRTALVGALKTSARQGGCDFGQRLSAAVTILGPLRPVRRNFLFLGAELLSRRGWRSASAIFCSARRRHSTEVSMCTPRRSPRSRKWLPATLRKTEHSAKEKPRQGGADPPRCGPILCRVRSHEI